MNDETKIKNLEEKILSMRKKKNRALRAMVKDQFIFGQKNRRNCCENGLST